MEWADIASAILRGAHLAALASLFGTLLFARAIVPALPAAPWARLVYARLGGLALGSARLALVLGVAWFALRAAMIAGADTVQDGLAALPIVALDTQFGHLLLARLAILVVLLALPRRTRGARAGAILLAAAALGLQPAIGHAGAMDGIAGFTLLSTEALHVWAAGAWLGALVPLLMCLATMPPEAAAIATRRFFPLGLGAVSMIAATSVVQAVYLVGSVPALIGTPYGRLAVLKALLFLVLLGLAALNRFILTARPRGRLRHSIAIETGFALGVTLAAGFLAHLTPGTHEQPLWPLSWRIDLATPQPSFVPAYPSSFFVSPTGFSANSIVHGERVYQANCAACHGAAGHGDGPRADAQAVFPSDLTTRRVLDYSDGDLFWFAGHTVAMAADDQWDLVDYLRAHNAGEFVRTSNRGGEQFLIPGFSVSCADGRNLRQDDLRGQVLRLEMASATRPEAVLPETEGTLMTIVLPEAGGTALDNVGCIGQSDAREALAILLGTTPAGLDGVELLVDPNGCVRGGNEGSLVAGRLQNGYWPEYARWRNIRFRLVRQPATSIIGDGDRVASEQRTPVLLRIQLQLTP